MPEKTGPSTEKRAKPAWYQEIREYEKPNMWKATWQLINTFTPFLLLLSLMYLTVRWGYPYYVTLIIAVPTAGLLGRIFIFFHDSVHRSYFKSQWANTILGYVCGILTFTPYNDWRRAHSLHHQTAGDLDRRGAGDVWTLTTDEFVAAPKLLRLAYRFFRNPIVLLCIVPSFLFLISHRFSHRIARKSDRYSVYFNNIVFLASIVVAYYTIGLRAYILVLSPVIIICSTIAVWVFFIQHQFDGVYWTRHDKWDMIEVGLKGSSYYKLPRLLQWFTGNIGYHHVHHLRPRIPNYNLQRCYDKTPALQLIEPLTIRKSLKSLRLSLWDEKQKKLVGFRSI